MDVSKKLFGYVVSIFLAIALAVLAIILYKKGEGEINKGVEQYDTLMEQFNNVALDMYDNKDVSGTELLDLLYDLDSTDGYSVTVKTGEAETAVVYKASTIDDQIEDAKTKGSDNYINPYGTFHATISTDGNGVITTIKFIQE